MCAAFNFLAAHDGCAPFREAPLQPYFDPSHLEDVVLGDNWTGGNRE